MEYWDGVWEKTGHGCDGAMPNKAGTDSLALVVYLLQGDKWAMIPQQLHSGSKLLLFSIGRYVGQLMCCFLDGHSGPGHDL